MHDLIVCKEENGDTKGKIIVHKAQNGSQYNCQKKKKGQNAKRRFNKKFHRKLKIRQQESYIILWANLGVPKG